MSHFVCSSNNNTEMVISFKGEKQTRPQTCRFAPRQKPCDIDFAPSILTACVKMAAILKRNECLQAFKLGKPEQVTRGNNAVKRFFEGVCILKLWNGFNHVGFFWEFGDCYVIMVRYNITGHIMVVANYYRTISFQ